MPNDSVIVRLGADPEPLEAALKKIEQSVGGLATRLDKGFGLFDVRIGVLKKELSALDAQAQKSGGILSTALEELGSMTNLPMLGTIGKALANLSADSARLETNFDRLFQMEPGALLSEFKSLESQLETIGAATEIGLPVTGIAGDISALKSEQRQVLDALINQASEASRALGNLTSVGGATPDTPWARVLAERLKEIRDILDQVRSISGDPAIKSLIDNSFILRGSPRQRGGALEAPAGGRTQLASSENGFATIAGETQALRDAQDTLSAAVERSDRALNEQASSIGRLDTATRDLGFTFASAFEDAVVEGRRLSDVLEGLERDILRILTRKLVTEPLAGALTGLIGGGVGAFAGTFHQGGKVGSTAVSGRVVPAALFAGAPRFAGGGMIGRVPRLAPGEASTILHRGEVVRTPAQEAALRGRFEDCSRRAARPLRQGRRMTVPPVKSGGQIGGRLVIAASRNPPKLLLSIRSLVPRDGHAHPTPWDDQEVVCVRSDNPPVGQDRLDFAHAIGKCGVPADGLRERFRRNLHAFRFATKDPETQAIRPTHRAPQALKLQ